MPRGLGPGSVFRKVFGKKPKQDTPGPTTSSPAPRARTPPPAGGAQTPSLHDPQSGPSSSSPIVSSGLGRRFEEETKALVDRMVVSDPTKLRDMHASARHLPEMLNQHPEIFLGQLKQERPMTLPADQQLQVLRQGNSFLLSMFASMPELATQQSTDHSADGQAVDFHKTQDDRNHLLDLCKALAFVHHMLADHEPVPIVPGLYLGSVAAAKNIARLRDLKISAILCVADAIRIEYPQGFTCKVVSVADRADAGLEQHFGTCLAFIAEHVEHEPQASVLVHCFAGQSRSVTITAAYLMQRFDWTLEGTLEYLRACRPNIRPNAGFTNALQQYEETLRDRGRVLTDPPSTALGHV